MSIRLYVGNLPEAVTRQELEEIFLPSEEVVSIKLITDRKTGKCRGFGFLTVTTDEAAEGFIQKFNGQAFKEGTLRIELAQPKTPKAGEKEGTPAAPMLAPRTERGEMPKPRPKSSPVLRTEKAVASETDAVEGSEELTATASTFSGPRPVPPVRRSTQTPATRAPRDAAKSRRTGGRQDARRQGSGVGNSSSGGGVSYRDLEEAGANDPRWAVLLEAAKKLELKV
ncbi:RNA recognition motif domain-containing protein [Anthocerotibacter panamensis]|uniref:RNA recognition motif domain-containing protein n=1 Tax=Anthocerotibacter panamensis TaxID=2857077 RepID=UPI001C405062|nr:RNA-binding protein [Anthocerotibacter panamensis]